MGYDRIGVWSTALMFAQGVDVGSQFRRFNIASSNLHWLERLSEQSDVATSYTTQAQISSSCEQNYTSVAACSEHK